jgi:5-methylcytosine-specific restriction enzyme A
MMERGTGENPAWQKLYGTVKWKNIKDHFRATQPMRACVCQAQDDETGKQCTEFAGLEIDHIIPHKGDWVLFSGGVNYENLQGLCKKHHSEKTARELAGKTERKREVIAWCGDIPIYGENK